MNTYMKNLLCACIGIWFLVSPWVFGFQTQPNAIFTCALLGSLQFVAALLALGKSGKKVWQNWVCLVIGALFIVVPNVFHLNLLAFTSFVVLGFMTILTNYSNLFPEYQ
ncbi:SPW repeat protein [Paenibacillus sp. HWE-109]|uniref:SPW repeat domain-containing protein n=1 Tax=Paenibacillus sp. HWE-109 TaxID=1306526 RepID=UPI001EDE6FE0|nr:SPW repeat protein [Paenibacillus sp. HWE-109]UKS24473.1 SPW repeat protein [Paenibacillus sp. HWE-109]